MDRFWAKVDKNGPISDYASGLTPCWLWLASKDGHGYGVFRLDGRLVRAHRLSFQLVIGEIPPGLELDHLCHVPACVRPDHLEPVTHSENLQRAADRGAWIHPLCPKGHMRTRVPWGNWICRECGRESARRYREKTR